jgi:hypothetical protein
MGELKFEKIYFTPEQARRSIVDGSFSEEVTIGPDRMGPLTCDLAAKDRGGALPRDWVGWLHNIKFPGVRGRRLDATVALDERFHLDQSTGKFVGENSLWFRLWFGPLPATTACGRYPLTPLWEYTLELNPKAKVQSVAFGNYDGDPYKDILVRLSDGAAYVFRQVPPKAWIRPDCSR